MSHTMTNQDSVASFSKQVQDFCEARNWDQFHNPKDLAIGLALECSELLELFRFKSNPDTSKDLQNDKFREKMSDELGDIFFMLLRFAQMNEVDLGKALTGKINKISKNYPVERSYGSNVKYSEFE